MNNYLTIPSGMSLFEAGVCLFISSFASSDLIEQEKIR